MAAASPSAMSASVRRGTWPERTPGDRSRRRPQGYPDASRGRRAAAPRARRSPHDGRPGHRDIRTHEALRRATRRRRRTCAPRAPRGGLRLPRAQRRGQDDDPADAARAWCARRRATPRCSARRPATRRASRGSARWSRRPASTRTSRAATTSACWRGHAGVPAIASRRCWATSGSASRAGDRTADVLAGMSQRLGVAAALLKDPELLVLDEPTNGLDPAGWREMRTFVGAAGRSRCHRAAVQPPHAEVEQVSDRVGVIRDGVLVAEGTVDELRGRARLRVLAHPAGRRRGSSRRCPGRRRRSRRRALDVAADGAAGRRDRRRARPRPGSPSRELVPRRASLGTSSSAHGGRIAQHEEHRRRAAGPAQARGDVDPARASGRCWAVYFAYVIPYALDPGEGTRAASGELLPSALAGTLRGRLPFFGGMFAPCSGCSRWAATSGRTG